MESFALYAKKKLSEFKQKKQTANFKMPKPLEPKKGKAKGKGRKDSDTRSLGACPLLPEVPPVHTLRVRPLWELQNITEEKKQEDVKEGTPPEFIIQQGMLARSMQSTGVAPQAAPESVMDVDATENICPLIIIPSVTAETAPPERTSPPQKKTRTIQLTASTGIIQATTVPEDAVLADVDVEYVGFTPSATTSTTVPGSGSTAYELDVSDNIERDLEPGEGSDVEDANVDCVDLPPQSLAEAEVSIDAEADKALRTVLPRGTDQDLLHFDWRCEPENFEGVREHFSVPITGPTFDNAALTPLDIFLKIWDDNIIAHIVQETNRYAREKLSSSDNYQIKQWRDVTDVELKEFLAIIMLQSLVVNNVEREYWYPKSEILRIGNFAAIMKYNRFMEIKRNLHFVDNGTLPEHANRLHKIMPIIEHLNDKFSSLYVLEQTVAIDESLLLWKGRLSFAQKIATKKARVGIKSYELYESRTGYLWRMNVYTGKGHDQSAQAGAQQPMRDEGFKTESATSQIVLSLMKPLFNRGHTVVMDNFYNAPLLSRILKVMHKTDSMGTLRLNREFVPEALKNINKSNIRAGEVLFSSTKDLSVVVWMDNKVVSMISTYHQVKVGGKEKHGNYRYKPQVILDYNLSMGGIDHKDQMLHGYPIERVRNIIWYKKLFRRLINVSIHNAFVMFNHNRTQAIGNREFRVQLANQLVKMTKPAALSRAIQPPPTYRANALSQMHLPAKNERVQRCKLCYKAKVRRSTVWRCGTCAVNLCMEGCYTQYHEALV